jgi:hypothetical protein
MQPLLNKAFANKHVPTAKNPHATIEELLKAVFSMRSVLWCYKQDSWSKLSVICKTIYNNNKIVRIIFSKLTSRKMLWEKQKCTFGKPVYFSGEYITAPSEVCCAMLYSVRLEFTRQGIADRSSRTTESNWGQREGGGGCACVRACVCARACVCVW